MARRWSLRSLPAARLMDTLVLIAIVAVGMLSPVAAITDPKEKNALLVFLQNLDDSSGNLKSWTKSTDPCESWDHLECFEPDVPKAIKLSDNYSHVTDLRLLNLNLGGQFVDELGDLRALAYLNVMWNRMHGGMPAAFGNLTNLKKLLINANQFSGPIPPEIGNLKNLTQFQIDNNHFSGQLPDSLAQLTAIKHLHMNNNFFTGTVPDGLEKLKSLLHILLDTNQLSGPLPEGLVNSTSLEIIQLDNNDIPFIPEGYAGIGSLYKLSLRNCSLSGSLPLFNQSTKLRVLDLSFNKLSGGIPTSMLPPNLTEVDLSHNQLNGSIPYNLGNLQILEYLGLSNNHLSGYIPSNLGYGPSFTTSNSANKSLPNVIVDLQNNNLNVAPGSGITSSGTGPSQFWLSGNPILCQAGSQNIYCKASSMNMFVNLNEPWPGETDDVSCPQNCKSPWVEAPTTQESDCRCALPIAVGYRLSSPSFKFFHLNEDDFRTDYLGSGLKIDPQQLDIVNYTYQAGPRIAMNLLIFPPSPSREFNNTELARLTTLFTDSNITFGLSNKIFGPFELLSLVPPVNSSSIASSGHGKGMGTAAKVGIAITAVVLVGLAVGLFFVWRRGGFRQVKGSLKNRRGMSLSNVNVAGVRSFSFGEMVRATDGFNKKKFLGEGGYGKVYLGVLENGQKVAIKRAEERSVQGGQEFENEIRMLSRVHHRNLVGLLGYCNDQGENINGEQMLVYEYVPNGNLWDHLNPTVKVPLDIITRMRIALGSARGLHYLHTQAKPPIFHRDIKAANILLDQNFDAKVSDFGLSKLAADTDADFEGGIMGHISTIVKGTPGYVDPEYFQTQRLTDKSDVYSFGVVLLQLMTGKLPFSNGQMLTREVNAAVHNGDTEKIIDPVMGPHPLETVEAVIRLALSCVHSDTDARPSMTKVLVKLEELWKAAPWPSTLKNRSDYSGSVDSREFQGLSKVQDASDFRSPDSLLGRGGYSGQFRSPDSLLGRGAYSGQFNTPTRQQDENSGSDLMSQPNMNVQPR